MTAKTKHVNIPVFIPHLGCPNNCVFCNQRSISGKKDFQKESVKDEIERALSTVSKDSETEIAYFGGSFTGIDRELMIYLLDTAESFVRSGRVSSVRLSTRPDYIDGEILEILSKYSVKTIELGLQSMDDEVLKLSKRGHDSKTAQKACQMVKAAGFRLVGQMMIGLPGSSPESEIMTAKTICRLGADAARVYPTVVFYGTELCDMTDRGVYSPLTEAEAVERTAAVLKIFDGFGVPCIRVGLCASENLSDDSCVRGGANQSAVGEMAMSLLFRENMVSELEKMPKSILRGAHVTVNVPVGCESKASGHKKCNKRFICDRYGINRLTVVPCASCHGYEVGVRVIPDVGTGGTFCT